MSVQPPAPSPCGSCPYRRDVASGVWSEDEYEKLPGYDVGTGYQPVSLFMCHQLAGRLCAGWVGCHDMEQAMSVRLAILNGTIAEADVDEILDYTSAVPLFGSGREAYEHGMAEIDAPSEKAVKTIENLERKLG